MVLVWFVGTTKDCSKFLMKSTKWAAVPILLDWMQIVPKPIAFPGIIGSGSWISLQQPFEKIGPFGLRGHGLREKFSRKRYSLSQSTVRGSKCGIAAGDPSPYKVLNSFAAMYSGLGGGRGVA